MHSEPSAILKNWRNLRTNLHPPRGSSAAAAVGCPRSGAHDTSSALARHDIGPRRALSSAPCRRISRVPMRRAAAQLTIPHDLADHATKTVVSRTQCMPTSPRATFAANDRHAMWRGRARSPWTRRKRVDGDDVRESTFCITKMSQQHYPYRRFLCATSP